MIDWEKLKIEFKFVFYCPKSNEFFLVKERYVYGKNKDYWFSYADKKLFGKDIRQDRAMKTWVYFGMI